MINTLIEKFVKYQFYKKFISKPNRNFKAIDITSTLILYNILTEDFYEKKELEFIKKNFYEYNSTFVDVGANIGNHSIFFSKYFKNVVSIEPSQFNFKLLKLNLENLKNIELFNCGCSNESKYSTLYKNRNSYAGMSLYPEKTDDLKKRKQKKFHDKVTKNNLQDSEKIKLMKLDDLILEKYKKISLIKFDVEGEEAKCLEGASKIIERDSPLIMFEEWNLINGSSQFIKQLQLIDSSYEIYFLKPINFFKYNFLNIIFNLFSKKKHAFTKVNEETGGFKILFAIKNKNIVNLKK